MCTGYADGIWDLSSSGHVEANETLKEAAIRETKEELADNVHADALEIIGLEHALVSDNEAYVNIYFSTYVYGGTPIIVEPDKCSELKWFPLNELPQDIKKSFETFFVYRFT